MAKKENQAVTGASLLIGGGLIGVVLALLLASLTEKETDQGLACFAKTIEGKVNETAFEFVENIYDMVSAVGTRGNEILQNGDELTPESKMELLTALEKGQKDLALLKERLIQMID
jgi:gas vesicle protein